MRIFNVSGILALHRGSTPSPSKPSASRLGRGHAPWHHLALPTGAYAHEIGDLLVESGVVDVDWTRIWIGLQIAGVGFVLGRRLKEAWLERQMCCCTGACPAHRPLEVNVADA